MPELPEVEMVRQQLADKLIGKEIAAIEVRALKAVGDDSGYADALVGKKITDLTRAGKYLFFSLSDDEYLIAHLRMTGRMIFQPTESDAQIGGGHSLSGKLPKQPHKHTRIIVSFTDGSHLYYNDMRKFGYMKRATEAEVAEQKRDLGVEPIAEAYTFELFKEVFSGRKTSAKAALLKQKDIAGLGNIYVDEACWRAQIRPDRIAGKLNEDELHRLYEATTSVLEDAISHGGTTFRDYVDTGGENGNFTDELAVFGREGQKCPRCGEVIEKSRVAGRGTHICPGCQK